MNSGLARITVFDSFAAARSAWREFEATADGYAFQSYAWLSAWHEATGSHSDVNVCIVLAQTTDGAPLILAPLGIAKRRGAACLHWLGGALSDYQAPLLCPDFAGQVDEIRFLDLWAAIQQAVPHHDAVFFEKQPALIDGQTNPFCSLRNQPHASSAHQVRLDANFDEFLARKRSKKTLSTERRKRNKLARLGRIGFEVVQPDGDIDGALNAMIRQKSENYRELGVADLFADDDIRGFVVALTKRHIADGFVHLSVLRLDERIVAAHWGLVHKKRLYYLLPSYERGALRKYSPGNILLHHLFQWCIDNGVTVCDFTVGDEPYKLQWRDAELKLFDHLRTCSLRGHAFVLPASIKSTVKRAIKRSPVLLNAAYALRSGRSKWTRGSQAGGGDT